MSQSNQRASSLKTSFLISTALMVCVPSLAFAQTTPATTPTTEPEKATEIVIITGTSRARAALETPLAVNVLDATTLNRINASSQADILNTVPTIKAEGGGGEVAANVFVKGLPSGGQFAFTPLLYDGMPAFSTFGLNSSAYDVYYRNDLGVQRLEFVRGGVSNLFGPGSVAGLINYISSTGTSTPKGTFQVEAAEKGRFRGDFAVSGPMSDSFFYALSGFYRTDDGPLETGNPTEGYQIRGNLKHEFKDGSGSFTVFGQLIDDQAQFFLPFPLNGTTRERVAGNDGAEVFSVQTPAVAGLGFAVPGGRFTTSITDGVVTKGWSLAAKFDKDLGNGWELKANARLADYDHVFDFFLDGDGIINRPETLTGFLSNRGLSSNATFTYADNGQALSANALLFPNRFVDRDRPATDQSGEISISKELVLGGVTHNITAGVWGSKSDAVDFNVTTAYLADFNNQARLVNLTVRDALGNPTIISQNGLFNAGGGYVNNRHKASRMAYYLANQMEAGKWVFDIGGRVERLVGRISRERTATTITDATTPNLSAALRDVTWGTGTFLTGKVDTTEWAASGGVLYRLTDDISVYANAARGYFFPEVRTASFNALAQVQSYEGEITEQIEAGVKFAFGRFNGTASLFSATLENRRQVTFVNDGLGGVVERVNVVSTESKGLEATGTFRFNSVLRAQANVTVQDHEYTAFQSNTSFIGKELPRQPKLLYNVGVVFDNGTFDGSFYANHTGDNFTSEANTIELEAFTIASLDAGYSFKAFGGMDARLGLHVFNVFDSVGITEGSPRQDTAQSTGGAYFVGRPVLPRRTTLRLQFNY